MVLSTFCEVCFKNILTAELSIYHSTNHYLYSGADFVYGIVKEVCQYQC